MSQTTIMIIIFCTAGLIIIAGILRMIDWYAVFSHFYGNNPQKGRVYVNFGENQDFYNADYIGSDDKWLFYEYRIGKTWYVVAVGIDWSYLFFRGRRRIEVDFGNEFAHPLTKDDAVLSAAIIKAQQGGLILDKSINSKIAVNMVNSMESRKGVNVIMVLVILAVIGGGLFFYLKNKDSSSQPVLPSGVPVEVQPYIPGSDNATDWELRQRMENE